MFDSELFWLYFQKHYLIFKDFNIKKLGNLRLDVPNYFKNLENMLLPEPVSSIGKVHLCSIYQGEKNSTPLLVTTAESNMFEFGHFSS